ncbi:SPFH domain-containing protein [Paenibacillus koleovorans]|uniref:SPFH domain-containing protein n=1 Tax=Paenibacillus koleovorans TaxID=121608 RepID=UPI000FDB7DDC|nr:SPFH domain-containing protein [Paenibacillus koleovorans]
MAIIDLVKYDGAPEVLAWKHPEGELTNWTQLIVNQSQEALLFKGGEALDLFGAGRHTLATSNIPLLASLVNLPFGGKSPFSAEVWFINKARTLDIKWGTPTPIQMMDPKFQLPISVRAFGRFNVRIENSRQFLVKLIGTVPVFDQSTLGHYFGGVLLMNINKWISSYLVHQKISILDINAYVGDISKHMEDTLSPLLLEYGIRLLDFSVLSINVPEGDAATQRLKDALAKRAEMDILGYTYQQARTFDTLEGAAKNQGTGSGIMESGIGLAMGYGIGAPIGGQLSQLTNQLDATGSKRICSGCRTPNSAEARFCQSCGLAFDVRRSEQVGRAASVSCHNCQKPFAHGSKFCPHCGDPYHACPSCQADIPEHAGSCPKCGFSLGTPCRKCGTLVDESVKFCPECGTGTTLQCTGCQTIVRPGQKFCLECGQRVS